MLSEKCGSRAYPYPLKYENQAEGKDWSGLKIQSNAEETVFLTKPLRIYENGVMALGLKTSMGIVTAVLR